MTDRLTTLVLAVFVALPFAACAADTYVASIDVPDVPEATRDPGVVSTPAPTTSAPAVDVDPGPVVSGTRPAVRGPRVAVPLAGTPPTTVPAPVDGLCDTWRPLLERYGLPWDEFEAIIWRESNCSHAIADRPSTGDLSAGAAQVNFYSYLADMWAASGWSWAMVRDDPEAAVAAAGAVYRMCGGLGPWTPPYSCGGNVLPTPTEMGYLP